MFARVGKVLVVVAFAATLGAQWTLLQTVAWTAMLADNLRTHSISESVARTFDGKHPCPICKAIAAGKKSEKQNAVALQMQKLEFPPVKENPALFAPSDFQLLPMLTSFPPDSSTQKPLTPPPRESRV